MKEDDRELCGAGQVDEKVSLCLDVAQSLGQVIDSLYWWPYQVKGVG